MAAKRKDENAESGPPTRLTKGWVVVLAVVSLVVFYFYHRYQQQQEVFINTHYFRTLQEAAENFNNRLDQLVSLHKWGESFTTTIAIFPSYQWNWENTKSDKSQHTCSEGANKDEKRTLTPQESFRYSLEFNQVEIHCGSAEVSRVLIGDILPKPRNDFALYMIADAEGRVLGSTGGLSGLFVADTKEISRQVQELRGRRWANLLSREGAEKEQIDEPLPGHSHYVDMELSSGSSRLFIQPFRLRDKITLQVAATPENEEGAPQKNEVGSPDQFLYLIGVLPDRLIALKESKRWNLSLLLLSVLILISCWIVARLVMLSRNEPLRRVFFGTTLVCTYAAFIMIVAVWIAYGEREAEIDRKQGKAAQMIDVMRRELEKELYWVFRELASFHRYYWLRVSHFEQEGEDGGEVDLLPLPEECMECPSSKSRRIDAIWARNKTTYERLHGIPPDLKLKEGLSYISLFGRGARFAKREDSQKGGEDPRVPGVWFDPDEMRRLREGPKLIDVFLMNKKGHQVLPKFYFMESNKPPNSYDLAYRDYFSKVRTQQGWSGATVCNPESVGLSAAQCVVVDNFYIQRLRYMTSGIKGSVVSMPLKFPPWKSPATEEAPWPVGDYIVAADVLLPSLSLTEWRDPLLLQDMVVMVVDRVSGEVLFHMDHERSMVENLFHPGQGTAAIRHAIRSGMFRGKTIPGYYQGRSGDFKAGTLPVSQWVAVVFIPDDNTDELMTNFFLATSAGMGAVLLLVAALLYLMPNSIPGRALAKWLYIPEGINRNYVLVFSAIFIASVFLGFRIGSTLERELDWRGASEYLSIFALLVPLGWGCRSYLKLRASAAGSGRSSIPPDKGSTILVLLFLAVGLAVIVQLHRVGDQPLKAMEWYYTGNLHQARLSKELQELQEIALTRYPNSIKRYGVDPLQLMPISDEWRSDLTCTRERIASGKRHLLPENIGSFGQLTTSTRVASWVDWYLLGLPKNFPKSEDCYERGATGGKGGGAGRFLRGLLYVAIQVVVFVLICRFWLMFYRRVIIPRMLGTPAFLAHLERLAEPEDLGPGFAPDTRLVIDLRGNPPSADNLNAVLQRAADNESQNARALNTLVRNCPVLQSEEKPDASFPGVRISCRTDGQGISVSLSRLDNCFAQAGDRAHLLLLIEQLKAMVLAQQLDELRVCFECHSYEILLLDAHTLAPELPQLSSLEMARWSEVLMDFRVELPGRLTENLDPAFIYDECRASGQLRYLLPELVPDAPPEVVTGKIRRRWRKMYDRHKSGQEWASINCILLKAGALFRYHWEACSSSGKLALYYLAKGKRVNPANTQLLEQLAVFGLIRMEQGRIQIINNSFAYFVRHAESTESLERLLKSGQEGTWTSYRLPVTLIVLFLMGAIAVTSGNSIYLIAASLMGLLGAVGSLVSSTRLIHESLK
ncbi:hypothetical protein [Microbulbifer marinus]|uniref:Cache domain-containing protein n=1 Tax=Microbulbifer marinus TaxID=658218 RepID=A0A1H4B6I8_9GAMM|nr:hypothetical protein [Microbulbifer marinus]SEA43568.1 hypothetical protein SAMN05216562_3127 [Microbulbifer marinus]